MADKTDDDAEAVVKRPKQHPPSQNKPSKYKRGQNVDYKKIKDKKLRGNMQKLQQRFSEVAYHAQQTEMLLPEESGYLEVDGMEKTYKITQQQLKSEVDITTANKGFELKLEEFGPYAVDYTLNGRHLLFGGRKGHVAAMDWREGKLHCELQLRETVRAVRWLHNESMFAVAQKKYLYIYDKQGLELHCMRKHLEITHMEYLPYHFLLTTIGIPGWLRYQDISTGEIVAQHRTKLGPPTSMTQNRHNAIIHVGHANGTVTLWSPNMSTPLVKMLTHYGPVHSLAIDREGKYMASSGADHKLKIWDLRTYKELHSYTNERPIDEMAISDTGLLALGFGGHVKVWKDALRTKQKDPYMKHHIPATSISSLRFCPYEDILGVGHSQGFSSLIIPGAGEANFDAREANPYETLQQRRETEVHMLLDKLQPGMITLDPDTIGKLDPRSKDTRKFEDPETRRDEAGEEGKLKNKQRGKNSALKRYLRKKTKNIIEERRIRLEAMARKENEVKEGKRTKEMLGLR